MLRIGWLADGSGSPLQHDVVMRVGRGHIISIESWQPDLLITRDLSKATVLPPLMDAHVHLAFSGTLDSAARKAQLGQTSSQARSAILGHLKCCWQQGVLAVRDGGDPNADVLKCKRRALQRGEVPVHVAATCWAWHARGRYGKMIGRSPADGIAAAVAVQENLDGIDHLKVIQSGLNSIDRFGCQGGPQFTADDLGKMITVAHDAGLPAMVHANGQDAVALAVDAQCDSIEHGYFMGRDNLKRMADRGIAWVPTVIPMAALAHAPGLTRAQQDVARRTVDHQLDQIRHAQTAGVTIALGTDAGSLGVNHGVAVRQELQMLISAGLSLPAAVKSATRSVARLMRLFQRGELLPGRPADFIAIAGAPENVATDAAKVLSVCIGGQWIEMDASSKGEIRIV